MLEDDPLPEFSLRRDSSCSTLLTGRQCSRIFNREVTMKTILVPVDFSNATKEVMQASKLLAGAVVSRVILLHVRQEQVEYSTLTAVEKSVGPDSFVPMPRLQHEKEEKVQEKLDELKKHYSGLSNDVITRQVEGKSVEIILEECEREKADMIVMGSHGHGALYNLLVGSVTSGVLQSAKCPVLVVPSPR